jgi:hypothetical protein
MPVVASVPASPSTAMIDAGVAGKPGAAIDAGRSIDAVATSNRRTSDTSAAYARTAHTGTAKICSAHTGAAATEATRADTAMSSGARFHRLTNGAPNAKRRAASVNAFGRTSRHGHRRADATRHCLQQARRLEASERFCPWRRSCVSSSRKPQWHYRGRQNRIEWSVLCPLWVISGHFAL